MPPPIVLEAPDKWSHGEQAGVYISNSQASDATDATATSQGSTASQTHRLRQHGSGTGAWNASITQTETSAQTFGFDPKDAKSRNKRLGVEMQSRTVGPMPVNDFLETFFAASTRSFTGMPSPDAAFSDVLPKKPRARKGEGKKDKKQKSKESDIYKPLITALNASDESGAARGSRCPGFTFYDTSDRVDDSGGALGAKKPDICCYANRHIEMVATNDKRVDPSKSRTDMGLAAMFFEVKSHISSDFFVDPPPQMDSEARRKWPFVFGDRSGKALLGIQEVFGQSSAYVSEVAMRQYRWGIYSVTVAGTRIRLMRWDRAGVVVTEAFDIHEHPEYLCKFFWCFSQVTDSERGYDMTVEPASDEGKELFEALIKKHIARQLPLASSAEQQHVLAEHYSPSSVTSIYLAREVGGNIEHYEYLVSRPIVVPLSVVGRSTRAYWAVDALAKKVVFLKDTWRSGEEREAQVVHELRQKGVANVPPVECHHDVPHVMIHHDLHDGDEYSYVVHERPQTTLTQQFVRRPWVCGEHRDLREKVFTRTHYRLVLGYAGFPLSRFTGTSELLHGAHDAFVALYDASELCGRVHRDVTPGNIILYYDTTDDRTAPRKGYLVDWEWSRTENSADISGKRHDASMMWQFLSAARATDDAKGHTMQDDMESLYYVVLYCGLLWLQHNLGWKELLRVFQHMFDWGENGEMVRSGGASKASDILTRQFTGKIICTNAGIQMWIDGVHGLLRKNMLRKDEEPEEWTPDSLANLWAKFFASESASSISRSDRVDNVKNAVHLAAVAPRSALELLNQPTVVCHSRASTPRPDDPPSVDSHPGHPGIGSPRIPLDITAQSSFTPTLGHVLHPTDAAPSEPSSRGIAGTSTANLSDPFLRFGVGGSGPATDYAEAPPVLFGQAGRAPNLSAPVMPVQPLSSLPFGAPSTSADNGPSTEGTVGSETAAGKRKETRDDPRRSKKARNVPKPS